MWTFTEAVVYRCSVKKVFLENSQNSQEKEALAQVFSCEFCDISKNTFSYRTPLVAASVSNWLLLESIPYYFLVALPQPRIALKRAEKKCFKLAPSYKNKEHVINSGENTSIISSDFSKVRRGVFRTLSNI